MSAKMRVVKEDEITAEPIDNYLHEVSRGTTSTLPYDRLMIYYRKQKNYTEELKVIRKGIAVLKKFYSTRQKTTLRKKLNSSLTELSRKIGKSTGLLDKKGNEFYLPDPIPRWIQRQVIVEQKLNKQESAQKKKKKSDQNRNK